MAQLTARISLGWRDKGLLQAKQHKTAYAGGEACGDSFLKANPFQPRNELWSESEAEHSPDVIDKTQVSRTTCNLILVITKRTPKSNPNSLV
jgi:hypothetical protein